MNHLDFASAEHAPAPAPSEAETVLVAADGIVVSIVGIPEIANPELAETLADIESAPDTPTTEPIELAQAAPTETTVQPTLDLISFLEDTDPIDTVANQTIVLAGDHHDIGATAPVSNVTPLRSTDRPNGRLGTLARRYEANITGEAA